MYEVTCADTDTGSADPSDVPFEVEAVPAKGRVISSDERTSDWYYRQSNLLKGQDVVTYTLMGSLKRRFEEMEDTIMMAESVFNASVSSERKHRLIRRISTDDQEKLEKQYSSPPCTCNDEPNYEGM